MHLTNVVADEEERARGRVAGDGRARVDRVGRAHGIGDVRAGRLVRLDGHVVRDGQVRRVVSRTSTSKLAWPGCCAHPSRSSSPSCARAGRSSPSRASTRPGRCRRRRLSRWRCRWSRLGRPVASSVWSPGVVIAGGVVSFTVMSNCPWPVFRHCRWPGTHGGRPERVRVAGVVVAGDRAGRVVRIGGGDRECDGRPRGTGGLAMIRSGTWMTGGVVSTTSVTVVWSEPVFDASSVTQTTTVLSPSVRSEPGTSVVVMSGWPGSCRCRRASPCPCSSSRPTPGRSRSRRRAR